MARISNYDYITGYFTQSILRHLGLPVERTTVAKVESRADKNEEVVVAFSRAVDHYDSGGPWDWGAQVNLGWAATDWFSVGIGTSVFSEEFDFEQLPGNPAPSDTVQWRSAYCLGVLLKNRDSTVLFELLSGFSFCRQEPALDCSVARQSSNCFFCCPGANGRRIHLSGRRRGSGEG